MKRYEIDGNKALTVIGAICCVIVVLFFLQPLLGVTIEQLVLIELVASVIIALRTFKWIIKKE